MTDMRTASTMTRPWLALALVAGLAACSEDSPSGASPPAGGDAWPAAADAATPAGDGAPPPRGDAAALPDGAAPSADGSRPARDAGPMGCEPAAALASCQACHGERLREAGLDLRPEGLEARLADVPSTSCPSLRLVDPRDPERSLLLAVIDPARHGALAGAGCALSLMPPGTNGLPAADVACLESYVRSIAVEPPEPPPADAVSADGALAKIKTILTGEAPTADERARVSADPANLRALVDGWTRTPAFEAKLQGFLSTALQQDLVGALEEQLDKPRGFRARIRLLEANVAESFARTALRIVRAGRPFTEIATTRDWEMTTALAMVLAYADQDAQARRAQHALTRSAPPGAPRPVTIEWMVAERTWVAPQIPDECDIQNPNLDADRLLDFLLGLVRCRGGQQDFRYENPLLRDRDFSDWRTVRIANASQERPAVRFYDLPALRDADELPLRIRRAGFFSTPAFLGNYPTNPDNHYRVTVNQSLLVALGATFSAADATQSFGGRTIDTEHAAPGTPCHVCHTLMDPMRVAFWDQFSPFYQRTENGTDLDGRFAFRGYRHDEVVNTPIALGRALAAHPLFKTAWVQRLCFWANSQACDEGDPRFQALADAFAAGGHDLRALVVDLFTSPLVTGLDATPSASAISITRANHLCPLLEARLGDDTLCDGIGGVLGLIPKDEFSRGEAAPVLTSAPNTFSFAAGEQLCLRIANKLVGNGESGRILRTDDVPGALATLVERLMGLHAGHPRHDGAMAALRTHFDEAAAAPGGNAGVALRSTAMVACLSPDVMGVGL